MRLNMKFPDLMSRTLELYLAGDDTDWKYD